MATISDPIALAALVDHDPDARTRAVALTQLIRCSPRSVSVDAWRNAATDENPRVRLRAAQLAPRLGRAVACKSLVALLHDADAWVAEAAAFAIGEHPRASRTAVDALAQTATSHDDVLVREAAVAALGAIGDPRTLAVVLRACDDRPAIRRRAVLALAAFDDEEVETRLRAALDDHDWQVRQAAEDVLRATP